MLPRPIRSEMSKATERCDSLPGCNYAIWQDSEEFCFTTDAVFLAAFPHLVRQARVLELGAGTGAISLLLAARGAAQVVGVDCNPHVVELMRRSIAANGLEECVSAELADLRAPFYMDDHEPWYRLAAAEEARKTNSEEGERDEGADAQDGAASAQSATSGTDMEMPSDADQAKRTTSRTRRSARTTSCRKRLPNR